MHLHHLSSFWGEVHRGLEIKAMEYRSEDKQIRVTPDMKHEDILNILPEQLKSFHKDFAAHSKKKMQWAVYQDRCFLSFKLINPEEPQRTVLYDPFGISPSTEFVPYLRDIIHLPGLRGNPRREYPRTAKGPGFPGTFEAYVATIIEGWHADDNRRLLELGDNLESLGLTWKVKAEPLDDTQLKLKMGRLVHSRRGGAFDLVDIADVGFGVSQSLPVIVALLAAHEGQLVYLEQPEIHLHPNAQRRLAGVLRKAVNRGVVTVVETHSTLLLRALQTLVAKGDLPKHNVILHWFQRQEDGETKVITAELDEKGAYGNWPEDFDDTQLRTEIDYLNAVEKKDITK
jgi:hypothetical protein